jgi:hypothetical protein
LATPDIARAVRSLLADWRGKATEDLKAESGAATAQRDRRLALERERREVRRQCQDLAGGGRRRRTRVGTEFDIACRAHPLGGAMYLLGRSYARKNRSPGRPRESGLAIL